MRASRSNPFVHFPFASKSNLVVSVCLPCRRIVAAAPLTLITRIEQEHMDTAPNQHTGVAPTNSKRKHRS